MSAPFTHTPIPPSVPAEDRHAWQRWFEGARGGHTVGPAAAPYECGAQVFRDVGKNVAEIVLQATVSAARLEARVEFDPAALREIAQRLLDAAHDIEANPAKGGAK